MREYFVVDTHHEFFVEVFYGRKEATMYAAMMNRKHGDKFRFMVKLGSIV